MKRISLLAVSLVAALCLAVPLVGCSSTTYEPQLKEQTVSDSALNTAGTLRVGVNASNAPYSVEQSGSIVGIDVDIAAALADEMGLKLELVDVGTGVDTAFSQENVDIVMGVSEANSAYWMSDPYMTSGIALFSLTQGAQAPTSAGSFKIAAQSSSMSAIEVESHYGSGCLENAADPQSAFDSLNTGAVDYVAADSTIGEYVVHVSGIEAYPIALLQDPSSYSIAVNTTNTALQTSVQEALLTLANGGVIDVIQSKWLGDQVDLSTLSVIAASANTEKSDGRDEDSSDDANSDSSDTENGSESSAGSSSGSSNASSGGSATE